MQVHWQPQPKQAVALARNEDEVLYGGARGGGKTDAGQAWLLYDKDEPRYRALVIRRNANDLKDWIDRARHMYRPCRAEQVGTEFRFPSGAIIRTGHLKDTNAYTKYQGHEYQKMLAEELTHIPSEGDFEKLLASNRSTIPTIRPQFFGTTNPDGPGHKWVKRRFGIPSLPDFGKVYTSVDPRTGRRRVFIPARLEDNPILLNSDPGYMALLNSIQDEELREAWLSGSWNGFGTKGAYYAAQIARAHAEGRICSVPHDKSALVDVWFDLGIGDAMSLGFFQRIGLEWHLIDYYEASGEGMSHYKAVLDEKREKFGYSYGTFYFPHDGAARELGTGRTRQETAESLGMRPLIVLPRADIDDGINAVRERFSTLWIDSVRCERLLDALGQYRKEWNDKLGEFKNHPLHDWTSHAADMLRGWAMTKTYSGQIPTGVVGGVQSLIPGTIA